ncbi:serine/threonine-protein kinase [Streptomyces lucensis]|uniref:serine/threonine-protein kinase n=1 Tax=Streptomyces lucensis TaxID=67319 RepID=UPI001679BF31|nr:serine/threonine-protein kinase [Streptomyces lucensis]
MEPLQATDPVAVGGYPLLARLGAGGMGQVYLSRTPAGRPLALKTVRADLAAAPDFEPRFTREIRNSDRVRSPFTVSVVDHSPPGHRPQWLATEYVAAPSLAEWVTVHGPLPPPMVRALAGELAAALAAVHACSLAHRDVKPSNILLGRERPMLIDFGIARAADDSRLTHSGGVIGSPGYLAPEQISHGVVTEAGDVFSFACVVVFAAAGRSPFQHPGEDVSAASLLYRIVHEQPHVEGVPPELLTVVTRCLAKEREQRPTGKELTELLTRRPAPDWSRALPAGLGHELAARQADVSRLVAALPVPAAPAALTDIAGPPPTAGPVPPPSAHRPSGAFGPPPPLGASTTAPDDPPGGGTDSAPSSAREPRILWTAVAVVPVVALVIALLHPFGSDREGGGAGTGAEGGGRSPASSSPASSSPAAATLPVKWAGVWAGRGPGNPRADGRLAPRTTAFEVTLTLHPAAVGELAGKQVSNVTEAGTGREVGCTEALELRGVRGTTATFEAVTSHPTDRAATLLTCEKGHVYVVKLTDGDTLSLGEEGAQSAGAPSLLRRAETTG